MTASWDSYRRSRAAEAARRISTRRTRSRVCLWHAALCLALAGHVSAACAQRQVARPPRSAAGPALPASDTAADLDAEFADPALAGALVAVRVESLADGRVLYGRHTDARVIPASTLKLITAAVAAERLGWDFRFETRLEAAGEIRGGVLHGDLLVIGTGDPSISAQGMSTAPLFIEWEQTLRAAGIHRVDGRIIGDDDAFDDQKLGEGWAWDYLTAGYAAPSSALSYNENVVIMRSSPGDHIGDAARVELGPAGHDLALTNALTTAARDQPASITTERLPGSPQLIVRGSIPLGARTVVRTTTIDNPTRYFVEAFRLALLARGVVVTGGAWDIDDLATPLPAGERRHLSSRLSQPLSVLLGYAMKVSQNFYGDMLLKAIGARAATAPDANQPVGSLETGRAAVYETLKAWGLPVEALAMYDGSGLSRYNYVSANLLVDVLKHVWHDERLRGPFVASLPVGGRDGTLENRMRNTALDRRVQAKTGTISNVRALAGYAQTAAGETLVFAMVANHFASPNAEVDRVMERALEELMK